MSARRAYLDWNASAPLLPEARAAMLHALECVGNPSSIHAEGRAARAIIEQARAEVAALVGATPENVVFTSGATEAANALIRQETVRQETNRQETLGQETVAIGATEHAAVLGGAGSSARIIPVDHEGRVAADSLAGVLAGTTISKVAIQIANSETGVVQDIAHLSGIARAHGARLICDAVQAPGRMPLDIMQLGASAIFLSAHKFGGPKGIGAIVFATGGEQITPPLLAGGGQERGNRAGTENLAGIAGMGAASRAVRMMQEAPATLSRLRDHFEDRLAGIAPDVAIMGADAPRLPNTSCFAIPGLRAEAALIALDLDGIALSSGSACSSGKVKASHVLEAMGVREDILPNALRLSIGPTTTLEEIERCLTSLERLVSRRRKAANAA